MDDKRDITEGVEYEKPRIADYGELQELTAKVTGGCTDVPLGGPVGIAMSCAI